MRDMNIQNALYFQGMGVSGSSQRAQPYWKDGCHFYKQGQGTAEE